MRNQETVCSVCLLPVRGRSSSIATKVLRRRITPGEFALYGAHELLFVYGTLLSGDRGPTGRTQRARLAGEARFIATGTTEGRLYDLGRYPGIVVPSPGEIVHGEVLELAIAARTLRWLDVYEGIVPGRDAHNEYERLLCDVMLDDGQGRRAWIYVYRGLLAAATHIPESRWLRT